MCWGPKDSATPSVANLNGMTVQFAISQFLALVNGGSFAGWDYLHFDQFTGRTIPAATTWQDDCPLCGQQGSLVAGDKPEKQTASVPTTATLESVNHTRNGRLRRLPIGRKTHRRN